VGLLPPRKEWALRSEPSLALRLCLTDATEGFPLVVQAAWLDRALTEAPDVEPKVRAGALRLAASFHNFLGKPS
jgi:hypothetical protein